MINIDKIKRYYIKLAMYFIGDEVKKAEWLKQHQVFHHIGENVRLKTDILPAEPFLVSLHDNVFLAAGVRLVTHSLTNCVFNIMDPSNKYFCQFGKIEICSNVFVGADAIIMYGVTIGKNCIVAAGSVVTKDIPEGSVVAGVPAKVIGTYEESRMKALKYSQRYDQTKPWWLSVTELNEQVPDEFLIDRT